MRTLAAILSMLLTSCGGPVTLSGFYRTTDGSKVGLSGTWVPVTKVADSKTPISDKP